MNVDRLMSAMKRRCSGLKIETKIQQSRGLSVWVWTAWIDQNRCVEIVQFATDLSECDAWVLGDPKPTDWDSSHSPMLHRLKTISAVCNHLNGGTDR